MKHYLIWDGSHGAYWGPNRGGYVNNILLAGYYTREEAEQIVNSVSGRERRMRIQSITDHETVIRHNAAVAQRIVRALDEALGYPVAQDGEA
ncbi:hypothetical protein [Luteitalea sp.]